MKTQWLLAFFFCTIYLKCQTTVAAPPTLNKKLDVKYEWKYLDYDFGSKELRNEAIKSGRYNHTTNTPIDVDYWQGKTFVTVIREEGVPSTLNTVTDKKGEGGLLLAPYPDWSWAKTDCTGIVSVYRVAIDLYDRLWVLDTGRIGSKKVCSAQLLVFDLHTSKLLKKVEIPTNIAENATVNEGLLVTPVVQTFGPRGENSIIYMADVVGYGLPTYYDSTKTFKRFTSSVLNYEEEYSTLTINGESFYVEDGPIGVAMSPLTGTLYLSAMASITMGSIPTNVLMVSRSGDVQFTKYKDVLPTQSTAKAMSITGTLFMGLVNNTAIGCWNEFRPLTKQNIVVIAQDPETLQFTSGLKTKIDECSGTEKLLVMTNRLQKIWTGTVDFSEVNFRILEGNVNELIHNTLCAPPSVADFRQIAESNKSM